MLASCGASCAYISEAKIKNAPLDAAKVMSDESCEAAYMFFYNLRWYFYFKCCEHGITECPVLARFVWPLISYHVIWGDSFRFLATCLSRDKLKNSWWCASEPLNWALEGSDGESVSVGLKYGREGEPEPRKALTGNFQISFLFLSPALKRHWIVMNLSPGWALEGSDGGPVSVGLKVWKERWTWASEGIVG